MHLLPPCGGYFRLVSSSPVATPPRRMRPLKFLYFPCKPSRYSPPVQFLRVKAVKLGPLFQQVVVATAWAKSSFMYITN